MQYLVLHKSYTKVIKLFLCLCFLPFHLSCPCQCFCPVQVLQHLAPPFNLIKDVKVILCLCVCSTNPPFPIFALRCPTSWPICCLWSHDAKCRNFILDFPNFQVSLEVVEKQPATFTWTCPTCQAGSWQGISTCPTCKAGSWVLTWQLATPPDQPADNSWAPIRKHLDRTLETFKEKRSPCCLLVFLRPFWLPQSIVLQWVRRSCDGRSKHKVIIIVRE